MATVKKPAKKMQIGGKIVGHKGLGKAGNYALTKKNVDEFIKGRNMKSISGNYKVKFKGFGEDGTPKATERRTTKGFLKGAPRAGGKMEMKMGNVTNKAKSGGSFPDLNKDGKITKADVLVGRGVIKANKGAKVKKAQDGIFAPIVAKKSKVDSVIKKRRAALDSSRAAFSRNLQKAKEKLKPSKKMMGGGRCKYGC